MIGADGGHEGARSHSETSPGVSQPAEVADAKETPQDGNDPYPESASPPEILLCAVCKVETRSYVAGGEGWVCKKCRTALPDTVGRIQVRDCSEVNTRST